MTERHYKLSEVEKILSVTRGTLLRWIASGRIKATKFGSNAKTAPWRISESTLTELQKPNA